MNAEQPLPFTNGFCAGLAAGLSIVLAVLTVLA